MKIRHCLSEQALKRSGDILPRAASFIYAEIITRSWDGAVITGSPKRRGGVGGWWREILYIYEKKMGVEVRRGGAERDRERRERVSVVRGKMGLISF